MNLLPGLTARPRTVAGLILAAGESSRMGTDKALLTYHGSSFLEHISATLREAGLKRVAVVLGHHAEEIRHAVKLRSVEVVINPNYRYGQTSSLQAGLRALDQPNVRAVVLCLVDHPAVSVDVIKKLVAAYRKFHATVVIPTYQGQRGHPVLIARALFTELLGLNASEGANTVIRKYRDSTQFVEFNDPGILVDVDDPQSYRDLCATT